VRPERTLRRGFSITRTENGTLVRDAAQVTPGTRVTTELERGRVESTIERVLVATATEVAARREERS
jgi:exodeoxyribonuclease VII large subunit